MDWIRVHELSNLQLCALVVGMFVGLSVAGLVLSRPWVRRWLGPPPASNEVVSYYLSGIGVFYGLTIGLVAVATWENFATVDDQVSHEVASVAALYRNVARIPDPTGHKLRTIIRDYVDHVIDVAWPAQRTGRQTVAGHSLVEAFERELVGFQARTEGETLLQQEALRQYNALIELVRLRVNSMGSGLPDVLWAVLYIGALLMMIPTFFLSVRSFTLHLLLTIIIAGLMGMLVFLIITMDQPFRGESGISASGFEQLREAIKIDEAATSAPEARRAPLSPIRLARGTASNWSFGQPTARLTARRETLDDHGHVSQNLGGRPRASGADLRGKSRETRGDRAVDWTTAATRDSARIS